MQGVINAGKKRGALLKTWLALMFIANIIAAIIFFFFSAYVLESYPNAPTWLPYLHGILSIANLVFIILLFKWKKWAFYAISAVSIIIVAANLFVGLGISSLLGLLMPIILYLVMRPKWDLFSSVEAPQINATQKQLQNPLARRPNPARFAKTSQTRR